RQDEDLLRDPADAALLQVRAAATAGGDRRGDPGSREGDQGSPRGGNRVSGSWPSSLLGRQVPLGRLADVQLGKTLQPEPLTSADVEVSYVRAGSLGGAFDSESLPRMFASKGDLATYSVGAGDLVVAEGGDVGSTEFLPPLPRPAIIQNSVNRVRSSTSDVRFI